MKKIKLFDPVIDKKEEYAIIKVLKSGFWASGAGIGNVLKFEKEFKKYIGSDECVAVNSGTAALNLALSLIDLKDKEVILPSFTFVSTVHAVIVNRGIPVFADIDPHTLCIDPDNIRKLITKKTKVILPVHFGGMPSDLLKITNICKEYQVNLIEDAAHAMGTSYKNKKIGKHGMAVCFSFHPVKNLAMPTGGLISLNHKNHKNMKKKLIAKRWCGITNRMDNDYDVRDLGWNYYMNEFSAAIGLIQLKKLDRLNKIRRRIADRYSREINLEQKMPFDKDCSYHFYWILVKNRRIFRKKLHQFGIETGTHYKPVHMFSMYKSKLRLPQTELAGKQIVTLPIHPNLTNNDIDKIIRLTNKFT